MCRFVPVIALILFAAGAWAQVPDYDRARRHFEAGTRAFQEGDYPRAELEFRAAFAITKDPLLYYNIGQAQQRRGHLEEALKSFRAYLQGVPQAEDKAEVEQVIAAIERELQRPRTKGEPSVAIGGQPAPRPKPEPTPHPEDMRTRRQSGWVIGGVSLALAVTGAVMSVLSADRAKQANDLMDQRTVGGRPVDYESVRFEFEAKKSDAATFGGVALGMYAAAAVGAGIATYLLVTSRPNSPKEREARLRVAPYLGARSGGLHAAMEF